MYKRRFSHWRYRPISGRFESATDVIYEAMRAMGGGPQRNRTARVPDVPHASRLPRSPRRQLADRMPVDQFGNLDWSGSPSPVKPASKRRAPWAFKSTSMANLISLNGNPDQARVLADRMNAAWPRLFTNDVEPDTHIDNHHSMSASGIAFAGRYLHHV
jgi:hypothetical protein